MVSTVSVHGLLSDRPFLTGLSKMGALLFSSLTHPKSLTQGN